MVDYDSVQDSSQTKKLLLEENTGSPRGVSTTDEEISQSEGNRKQHANLPSSLWQRFTDRKGLLFAFISGIASCGQFIFVNLADSDSNFRPVQCIFIRDVLFLVVMPLVTWQKSETYGWFDTLLYILYGFCTNCAAILTFTAFQYADIGNVSAVALNIPIPSAILGYLLLNEKISFVSMVCFAVNFVGILLLAKPPFLTGMSSSDEDMDGDEMLGVILACLTLFCLSLGLIPIRKLSYRGNADSYLSVVTTGYVGMVMAGVFLSVTNDWTLKADFIHWIYVLLFSCFALVTIFFVSLAVEHEFVANVSVIIACTSSPLSFLAQVVLFHKEVELISLAGLALIIGSTVGYCMSRK